MGRFKLQKEREMKSERQEDLPTEEDNDFFQEIEKAPGYTGNHEIDAKNPNIQAIVNKRKTRVGMKV